MIPVAALLLAGGALSTGTTVYKGLRSSDKRFPWLRRGRAKPCLTSPADQLQENKSEPLRRAERIFILSSISLGLTTTGLFVKPALVLVSVPVGLFIFASSFQSAWRVLRRDRRIDKEVLDATRITVCIVMGYYFALALDTWLRTVFHKMLVQTELDLAQTLDSQLVEPSDSAWVFTHGADVWTSPTELSVGDIVSITAGDLIQVHGTILHGSAWVQESIATGKSEPVRKKAGDSIWADSKVITGQIYAQVTAMPRQLTTTAIRKGLDNTIETGTFFQKLGEAGARRMPSRMLALSGIMLSFWGANRAAGFLTTSFGGQMSTLGPYTLQNFMNLAAHQQLIVLNGRALEKLNLVNTILIEAGVLNNLDVRASAPDALRMLLRRHWPIGEIIPHRFAIYLIAEGDEPSASQLAAEIGADDYFVEPLGIAKAMLIERLQASGRLICYVTAGDYDPRVIEKALVSVDIPTAAENRGLGNKQALGEDGPQIVLVENDLQRLVQLFDIAALFAKKQSFNLAWPLLMDLLDIGTTVFVHFGLVYSLMFSYSGTLVSAINARLPLVRYRRTQEAGLRRKLLPVRK